MHTPKLEDYQVDHLFLLMGGNALPNYVAARTLLKPRGKAYLIHTGFSELQTKRIAELLTDQSDLQPAQLIDLKLGQAEASVIRQAIQAIAQNLEGRVGLNYTGGTKAMSVYAHRTLSELYPEAVFSYLDSNTLEMMIDDEAMASHRLKIRLKLSFEQLFRLHGLEWRSDRPPLHQPIHPVAASELVKLFAKESLRKNWRKWCRDELWQNCKNAYDSWLEEQQLAQLPALSLQGLHPDFQKLLEQNFGAMQQHLSLQATKNYGFHQQKFQSMTQVCEWLSGIWLEHYVLQQVQHIATKCQIHESRMSFRMQDPTEQNRRWNKFEFESDVAFMRHYQLFMLSCTSTERRSLCKQKLIEANTRAQQLGGIEARVALVCARTDTDSLRKELEVATRNRKIAVFGRQDWTNLGTKIMEWVKQNE
jgi:hypothetical protein